MLERGCSVSVSSFIRWGLGFLSLKAHRHASPAVRLAGACACLGTTLGDSSQRENSHIPALAWSPIGPEIKARPGPHPVCWGLIVGYNEDNETYTARHPWVDSTYTVPYDALGTTDDAWFNVKVFDQAKEIDSTTMHHLALQHAVELATETRYEESDQANANRRAIPHGFSAYEVWHKAFESEDVPLGVSKHHAYILSARRSAASEYMRELVDTFPEAKVQLETAAAAYDRELEFLNDLYDVCVTASTNGTWTTEARTDARTLISDALVAEREAVASIQSTLTILEGQ